MRGRPTTATTDDLRIFYVKFGIQLNQNIAATLDIILPCYNPEHNWTEHVIRRFELLSSQLEDIHPGLIIVNDGSGNINPADISHLKKSIPGLQWLDQSINRGKGAALRLGVSHSQANFIVFTDIDFPYTDESTLAVCRAILDGNNDVVVGQRENVYYEQTPFHRKVISKLLRTFNKYVLRIPVNDTQCGLKGFNNRGRDIFLRTTVDRYLFDLEFLILAGSKKYHLHTLPLEVSLREGVTFSKLNSSILFTEGLNIFKIVLAKWFSPR